MPKFKLIVSREGEDPQEAAFDAATKKDADEYGPDLARFGGFDPDDPSVKIQIKSAGGK